MVSIDIFIFFNNFTVQQKKGGIHEICSQFMETSR